MRNIYVEILDVLEVRREYLERDSQDLIVKSRLDELKVVRAIINTLRKGEDE